MVDVVRHLAFYSTQGRTGRGQGTADKMKRSLDLFRLGNLPGRPWWRPAGWSRTLAAIAIMLAACSPLDLTRFNDAARRVADRIGGTGGSDEDHNIARTGIVGTITGLGSVVINGFTVEFDQETVLTDDGVLATGSALSVGQVVAIEAETGKDRLWARSISITNAVSGPITAVAASGTRIEVLGQTVALDPASLKPPAPANLRTGQWVTVSGLRNAQGTIVAGRVSRRAAAGRISVRGPVTARTASGFTIGRLSIVSPGVAPTIEPGRTTLAIGALTSTGLRAARVEVAPAVPFDGRVSRLSIEGFVGRSEGLRLSISGIQVSITANTVLRGKAGDRLSTNDRVMVDAVVEEGNAIAETIDAGNPVSRGAREARREDRRDRNARARNPDSRCRATPVESAAPSEARPVGKRCRFGRPLARPSAATTRAAEHAFFDVVEGAEPRRREHPFGARRATAAGANDRDRTPPIAPDDFPNLSQETAVEDIACAAPRGTPVWRHSAGVRRSTIDSSPAVDLAVASAADMIRVLPASTRSTANSSAKSIKPLGTRRRGCESGFSLRTMIRA